MTSEVAGITDAARDLDGSGLPALGSTRLSHELRTPLNAILGNAELLLDGTAGPLSGDARACLGDIQVAGQRMLRQVQVLLDLCHARSRPGIIDEDVDLIGLLWAARSAAPGLEPGQAIEVVPADARCVLRGDRRWLGALALALVELPGADGQGDDPLQITVEQCRSPGTWATLALWWQHFQPDQVAALPLALIDAVLDLHDGAAALTGHGLRLNWPAARVVQVGSPGAARARGCSGSECC